MSDKSDDLKGYMRGILIRSRPRTRIFEGFSLSELFQEIFKPCLDIIIGEESTDLAKSCCFISWHSRTFTALEAISCYAIAPKFYLITFDQLLFFCLPSYSWPRPVETNLNPKTTIKVWLVGQGRVFSWPFQSFNGSRRRKKGRKIKFDAGLKLSFKIWSFPMASKIIWKTFITFLPVSKCIPFHLQSTPESPSCDFTHNSLPIGVSKAAKVKASIWNWIVNLISANNWMRFEAMTLQLPRNRPT